MVPLVYSTLIYGRLIIYPTGGGCVCDVEDVARGHVLALDKGRTGERYILGGDNYTWKDLFSLIAEVLGVPPPRRRLPTPALHLFAALAEPSLEGNDLDEGFLDLRIDRLFEEPSLSALQSCRECAQG